MTGDVESSLSLSLYANNDNTEISLAQSFTPERIKCSHFHTATTAFYESVASSGISGGSREPGAMPPPLAA